MINTLIEGISKALHTEFGNGYKIYMEEIKQGLTEPCFFIQCLNPDIKPYLSGRYLRHTQMLIQYFPSSDTNLERECHSVAERMLWCLEWITIKNYAKPFHGLNMNYEIVDGILNFKVNYNFFIRSITDKDEMSTYDERINAKG